MAQILETGITVFSEEGLDRANINTIAKRAGVSVGVIYKYYGDKDTFFLACVKYSLQSLDEVLDKVIDRNADLRTNLVGVLHALQTHAAKHPEVNVMYNELTTGSCRKYAAQLAGEIEMRSAKVYRELFENAMSEGLVRDDTNPQLLAFFFDNLLMMLQFSYSCNYYRERMKIFCGEDLHRDDRAIAEGMADFLLHAVMKNAFIEKCPG